MNRRLPMLSAIAAAAIALGACEMKVGGNETDAAEAQPLENSAGEGTFSIDAPGFEMKVDLPKSVQDRATIDSDSKILPPGAKFRGIHIQGGTEGAGDGVEMRFSDPRAPREVAEYYRAGPSGADFTIGSVEPQGDGFVIAGKTSDGDDFGVRLAPGQSGGTDGRLAIRERAR